MTSLQKTLGWLSLGLGAAAILAPFATARLLGVPSSRSTKRALQAVGVRELGVGTGLLATRRFPATWTWLRVAGDAIDLALLANAAEARRSRPKRVAGSMAAISGVLALDTLAAAAQSR